MEPLILIAFLVVLALFLLSKPHINDMGGGRSDYNVGDKKAIVPDALPSKKSRMRRKRRKRFANVEAAEESARKTDVTGSEPSS